jgi:hypothetical protein
MPDFHAQLDAMRPALWILPATAFLAAAMGFIRPVRKGLRPRESHVIQSQVLIAVVGAVVIIVVQQSLARAFAIAGIAGLVRYRAKIEDPKDAGVLLVSLAIGLMSGTGQLLLAALTCVFVIGVLWLLESLEPVDRTKFNLVVTSKDALHVRARVEHALRRRHVRFELWGSSPTELRYSVVVPFNERLGRLTRAIRGIDKHSEIGVEWKINKNKGDERVEAML